MLSSKESQFFLFANVEFALGNSRSGCELILEKKKKGSEKLSVRVRGTSACGRERLTVFASASNSGLLYPMAILRGEKEKE